ncbi:MAG: hypothetical protein GY856_19890, partial [bacterium]|nr:hypothetical protein [bacterium]
SDEVRELPEVRSLLAEIEVRRAVRQGEELVDEDRLDEAEAGLRDANRRREELLYTEQLEESIGNLRQLWSGVEELRRLYARSDALERRGEFGEAAAVLWRARAISHGARSAQRRYQKAATLAGIRELVRRRDLGKAVRECDRAASLYRGEAAIESLRQEVERQRCGQLRRLAADARSRRNYLWEKELVEELCRLDPEDSAAPARLGEIAKDLAVGYREGVAELARQLECRRSAEICDEVVRKLSDNGWTQFDEGRALAAEAKALMRRIADLAQRFDRLDAEGDVEAVLQLLAEAQAERILLHGTSPEELREGIGQRLAESRLREIADRLRAGSIDEALERCESRLQIEPEEARRQELLALREKARDLAAAREQIRSVEGKIERSEDRGIRGLLSELRLRAELLDAVRRALRQEPQLEGLHGDRDPERLEVSLLRGLDQAMERLRSSAYGVLFTGAPGERTAVRDDASAALALLGELEVLVTGEPPALRRWRRWCEELLRLEDWIDLRSEAAASATPAGLAALLTPLGASDEVLAVLSRLGSENEPGQSRAALEEVSPDSPVAEWLRQAVEARSLEAALWQELGHNAPEARRRLDRHPRGLAPLRRCLPLAERAHAFLAGAPDPAQVSAPERLAIEREAAELARELGEVPRLRDGRYRRELGALAERLSRERQTRISELRARLAERIESFTLAESFENRVPIEQQVTEAVAELREIDEEAAAEAEKRFDHAVEYLLRDPAQHPAEAQDRDRLAELQRRVVELAEREPGRETRDYLARFDRDQTFRAVQPFFRRRHDRFRQALRRVQGPAPGRVEALLRLRLQYGEFPELVEALWQARREIAQAAARERFRELERLDAAALAEHWHEHESTLRALDASLLEERDRERYHQLEEAVGHLRILAEELGQPALAAYLHGRHNGRGAQWSRALEWGVAQRIGGRALAPATVRNLESTMQRILARGSVSPQTMSTFYYLEALIRRLRFPEAGPVGRAAGGRGGRR